MQSIVFCKLQATTIDPRQHVRPQILRQGANLPIRTAWAPTAAHSTKQSAVAMPRRLSTMLAVPAVCMSDAECSGWVQGSAAGTQPGGTSGRGSYRPAGSGGGLVELRQPGEQQRASHPAIKPTCCCTAREARELQAAPATALGCSRVGLPGAR